MSSRRRIAISRKLLRRARFGKTCISAWRRSSLPSHPSANGATTSLRWYTNSCGAPRARLKKDLKTVSAEAMTALINYQWPGNVRELEHAVERAAILAHGTTITLRELPAGSDSEEEGGSTWVIP